MLAFGMACAAYDSNDCRAMLTIEHTIPESVSPSAEHPEGVPLHFSGGLLGFETNKPVSYTHLTLPTILRV